MKTNKIKNLLLIILILMPLKLSIADELAYSVQDFLNCPDPFKAPSKFNSTERALGTILQELAVGMNIKGVVVSSDKSYVIIKEEIIAEGDIWQGLLVEKIFPEKMLLRYKDEIKEFHIKKKVEKTDEK